MLTLSDQSQKKLESRRALEWKLKIGLWVGILLIGKHVLSLDEIQRRGVDCSIALLLSWLTLLDWLWTKSMQESHLKDQAFHLYYRSLVDRLLEIEGAENRPYPDVKNLRSLEGYKNLPKWTFFLWSPTLVLSCGFFLLRAVQRA